MTVVPARARRSRVLVFVILSGVLAASALARLLIGEVCGWPGPDILALRLKRLALGLGVGVALAVSGALLQAVLRNPLASPYVLGLSSGATLGVLLASFLPAAAWGAAADFGADHTAALLGALAVMAVVYVLGQRRGRLDPVGLLLVGVIVNAINGAAIMFLSHLTPNPELGQVTRWMLGYLNEDASWAEIGFVGAATLAGTALAARLGPALDVSTLSSAEARSLGLRLERLRLVVFVLAGFLTAGSVLLAGPIGFVGLIAPHLARLALGPRHRMLVVGAALAGGALVVSADAAVKLIDVILPLGGGLLPVGVLTALVGGPVFLGLLRSQLGRGDEP